MEGKIRVCEEIKRYVWKMKWGKGIKREREMGYWVMIGV